MSKTLELVVGVPPLRRLDRCILLGESYPCGVHTILEPSDELVQAAMDSARARVGMRAYLYDGKKKPVCGLCQEGRDHWCKLQEE